MNESQMRRATELLDHGANVHALIRVFDSTDDAYRFFAQYAQRKASARPVSPERVPYVCKWQREYPNRKTTVRTFAGVLLIPFGHAIISQAICVFTTVHHLKRADYLRLRMLRLCAGLLRALLYFWIFVASALILYGVIAMLVNWLKGDVFAWKPLQCFAAGIILLLPVNVFERWVYMLGLPDDMRDVCRGVFHLVSIKKLPGSPEPIPTQTH
ncbi:MAG: hypothetical protein ABSH19_09355 [Opitutales bacterium]|jgi:hypothetical protein